MALKLGVLALVAGVLLLPTGEAFHGETCNPDGATSAPAVVTPSGTGVAFAGTLEPNGLAKWTFTLPPGEHYAVADGSGDVGMVICKVGYPSTRHACQVNNFALWPETCLLSTAGNPNSGTPILGPGNFVVYITNCWTVACGYPFDMPSASAYAGAVFGDAHRLPAMPQFNHAAREDR